MEYKYSLIEKLKKYIEESIVTEIEIGCSDSQVIKIEQEQNIFYLKMAKLGTLTKEYEKLKWLSGKLKVPEIILYEVENNVEYLLTRSLLGEMVCSDYYIENWKQGISIIVESFKRVYEVDISDCPFDVSLDYKLALVKKNIDDNLIDINNISKEVLSRFETVQNIYNYLLDNKFEEELCFSHGDVSLPNVFAYKNAFSGFIDVGECGIADKWFDIAIAVKSIRRNYGEEATNEFFNQLGIKQNYDKINYYLLLMELYL